MMLNGKNAARWGAGVMALALVAGGGGYWLGQRGGSPATEAGSTQVERKILYWYDPMVPAEHYDNPNSLSSMGMKTIPKYADAAPDTGPGVSVDAAAKQNLGMRVVAAEMGALPSGLTVNGTIDFNQRDVGIAQARSGGFVTRVYARAPGDVIGAGAPIADLQLPEWGGAQGEFLAVKRLGRPDLTAASRQRLRLMGMSDTLIGEVERTGRTNGTVTIRSPIGGVIQTLDVRPGMTLAAGQSLAQVSGIGTVWLNAAVPEAQAGLVRTGQGASATLAAFPGETFAGRVAAILPAAQADSHTLTVRIELVNRGGRLRPGMFAQVIFAGDGKPALLVPSEAVIRTGARALVMLALPDGRYRPAEVRIGREGGGRTEVLAGLAAGEKVVSSGQFLLDSEASLTGIAARPIGGGQ
ncbi:efflux RND transporter periplasmic adaptor subunit [Novosphingobium cyanobacteriorum]|uniref:Efflux RND transporter periplasmic adaptor subunit n=1 Tax=Novosphingobium cyanobacteriorum TaxID=3024215 RepID=A0ABT6CNK0_9SPHN|nr:efflux RND transporter periplasmic adaptor subunit [Novosphingobium cyanobacteriorum]MDF8335488.1 efflux RND transporter periplasmic adaptor subunit [Novosphingobium cyanobacteriorum]